MIMDHRVDGDTVMMQEVQGIRVSITLGYTAHESQHHEMEQYNFPT